jgi:hypothetical protein
MILLQVERCDPENHESILDVTSKSGTVIWNPSETSR